MAGRRPLWKVLVAAAPAFGWALMALLVWHDPTRWGDRMLGLALFLALFEVTSMFPLALGVAWGRHWHPRAGVTTGWRPALVVGTVVAFGWPVILAAHFDQWVLLGLFVAALAAKVVAVRVGTPDAEGRLRALEWTLAATFAAAILGVLAAAIVPVPELGVTEQVLDDTGYFGAGWSGLFIEEPHRAMAFLVVHFVLLGIFEFGRDGRRAQPDAPIAEREATEGRGSPPL